MATLPSVEQPGGAGALAARVQQKVLGVSALLREIDNGPIALDARARAEIDRALEMLACRVAATRALLRLPAEDAAA